MGDGDEEWGWVGRCEMYGWDLGHLLLWLLDL